MITFPNAKINLGLNIIEKRPDGYHNLETIFYPIHLQDALEVTRRENNDAPYTLHVKGTAIEGKPEDNLVVRAYELLKKDHDIPPVDIHLFKHIPTGAGLGGGSSDCAFTIKLLNEKFRLALSLEEMEDYAARLGADCAFFIRNQPVFATGIGNLFEPVHLSLSGYYLVLVKPDIFVSTRDAFAHITPRRPEVSLKDIICQPVETWKDNMKNDCRISARHERIGIRIIRAQPELPPHAQDVVSRAERCPSLVERAVIDRNIRGGKSTLNQHAATHR